MAHFSGKDLDPLKIFRHAVGFHQSYKRLIDTVLKDSPPESRPQEMGIISLPAMAISAFSSELYFKCLLCLERNDVPGDHNLKRLFEALQVRTRQELDDLWDIHIRRPENKILIEQMRHEPKGEEIQLDLRYALNVGANSFMELRYFYEKEQSYFLILDLPNLIRVVILKRIPTWDSILPKPSRDLTR